MKKILLACGAVAMMLAATSCGSKGAADSETAALSDSIAIIGGQAVGYGYANQWQMFVDHQPDSLKAKFDKKDFLRGLEAAIKTDTTSQSYMMGFQTGLGILNDFIMRQGQDGVKIDIAKFLKEFKTAFLADSAQMLKANETQDKFSELMQRVEQAKIKAQQEQKAKSPEAIANKNAGEAFVKKAKEADPEIKTTQSGLSYKIAAAGEGEKVKATDKVKIAYTGKLVDGTVFDQSEGVELSAGNMVPGFTEGLLMLGKGGKATLYIPADLAYGIDGVPQANIGPNSTLVFEVEVLDILKPQEQPVGAK
jgi:FKBP-type peptidyl-prolyl cis-trans isomerase